MEVDGFDDGDTDGCFDRLGAKEANALGFCEVVGIAEGFPLGLVETEGTSEGNAEG